MVIWVCWLLFNLLEFFCNCRTSLLRLNCYDIFNNSLIACTIPFRLTLSWTNILEFILGLFHSHVLFVIKSAPALQTWQSTSSSIARYVIWMKFFPSFTQFQKQLCTHFLFVNCWRLILCCGLLQQQLCLFTFNNICFRFQILSHAYCVIPISRTCRATWITHICI